MRHIASGVSQMATLMLQTTNSVLHHSFTKHLMSTFSEDIICHSVHNASYFIHSEHHLPPRVKAGSNPILKFRTKFYSDSISRSIFPKKGYLFHYRKHCYLYDTSYRYDSTDLKIHYIFHVWILVSTSKDGFSTWNSVSYLMCSSLLLLWEC